ncbi:unnamed protein product [Lupinus luteus]|uniref:Uncharacterized protein n=1 Tax=Lupinus luteus TaxID=3873 RepID=A0AAV1VU22_LUPLU
MKKVIMENGTIFPYGMLLTKIFNNHNLNLEGKSPDRECGPRIIFDYNIEDITYSRLAPCSADLPPFLEMKEENDEDDYYNEDDHYDDLDDSYSSYSEDNDDVDDKPLVVHTVRSGGREGGAGKRKR